MELLRRLEALQASHGAVDDAALERLHREAGVPLYRLEGLRSFYPVFRDVPGPRVQVQVCRDLVCRMRGGADHCARLGARLAGREDVEVTEVSCLGRCDAAPAAVVDHRDVSGDADTLAALALGEAPLPQPEAPPAAPLPTDPYPAGRRSYAVLKAQASRGHGAAEDIIAALEASGLAGLGGAAFPTAKKWHFTRIAEGGPKVVVCNADESEPGTFKDREILERAPHLVVEGMALGALTIGARRGIIYLRHEYQRARDVLEQAIADAYDQGALGDSVFGTDFGFHLEVFVSPGGYILGEETALLEALEDRRGEPRNKPPFPTNVGLHAAPTLINNVETLAAVPAILAHGPDWWTQQGVGEHKGLKYVCASGDVERPGVHCLSWGTPAREMLERCGGVSGGRQLKAFSPGGASTAFLPASALDTALDFKAMAEAGSGLGTGAMVFVAEGRDLLDVVLAQVRFFRNESCGKCVPCRLGSRKAVELVEQARAGGAAADLPATLSELHSTLMRTSICGLGQVALLSLVDALERFPDEPSLAGLRRSEP